jgi:hypothetical protein
MKFEAYFIGAQPIFLKRNPWIKLPVSLTPTLKPPQSDSYFPADCQILWQASEIPSV